MVMTGGMLPQRWDAIEVVALAQAKGKPAVVGGPDVTSLPEAYVSADFRVLGEAEGIIDSFISAWNAGVRHGLFEAEKFKADVTTTPVPRFDLLKREHYAYLGISSRGAAHSLANFVTLLSFMDAFHGQKRSTRCWPSSIRFIAWAIGGISILSMTILSATRRRLKPFCRI